MHGLPWRCLFSAVHTESESAVRQRLTGGELVRIDVAGARGATGVIAWQIDAV
ncbi:hypothetical protein [Streptomyces nigra]|uniref:hypothetical protein n=1 Tax=Streptomyces nigra TaxID=1827580 RepID=UPI0034302F13